MKASRRLMLMTAGLMLLCSSSFAWIGGQMPINASFGNLLSTSIATISGHSISINISALNQISMAAILFVVGVIVLTASVLGSRLAAIVGVIISVIATAILIISTGISLDGLINNFAGLGTGTHLAMGGILLALLSILLPRLHLPGRSS